MTPLKRLALYALSAAMVAAGVAHFVIPGTYVAVMPPYLPGPLTLVYVSGAFEIALGLLLLVPAARRLAAWGLIALFVAVFPAHVHMLANAHLFPSVPEWLLWARPPFQAVFVAWAYWFARPGRLH